MNSTTSTISDRQFVKIRCGTDSRTYYFSATGAMYAHPLDVDEPRHLFDFLGVDISRCVQNPSNSQWTLVSRKITLYLDPQTQELLRHWQNPWTGETLNVMHRSYDYQEFPIPPQIPATLGTSLSSISLDRNTKKTNPLAQDPQFAEYSPEAMLQSSDSYKFIFPTKLLDAEEITPSDIRSVALSYYRMGPWEPWMKMKGKPGFIVLNYTGTKTDEFEELHPAVKTIIRERMPLYYEAPVGRLKRSIATSWTRFDEIFEAYLQDREFPLPAPIVEEACLEA